MKQKIEVLADRQHPALWRRIDGRWKMTPAYLNLWWQYQKSQVSRATFFRKKAALKAAYDSAKPGNCIPPFG